MLSLYNIEYDYTSYLYNLIYHYVMLSIIINY